MKLSFDVQEELSKCKTLEDISGKNGLMYAKGMTVRDIQEHIKDYYGVEVSPTTISNITDKVMSLAAEWQARPLSPVYAIVFFDAIHYHVRNEGKVVNKAAYTCLGVDLKGSKDVLGLWVGKMKVPIIG